MSEERDSEQAGAPVEQAEATETQVLAAVERAVEAAPAEPAASETAAPVHAERPVIAEPVEPPSAARVETAEEIFASHASQSPHAARQAQAEGVAPATPTPAADQLAAHFEANEAAVREFPASGAASADTTTAAATVKAPETAALPPVRDGEIRISADHPMAALYMQTPMPPEVRGNRGAGVLISLLATVAFAAVFAGALSLWLAPNYPPSTFLDKGLLPWVLNWGFAAASVGFLLGMIVLVLIVGRAGWWAYVLGGFFVAALTWAFAAVGFALNERLGGTSVSLEPYSLLVEYGLFFPVIIAGIVAREAAVWFGAWIGKRGRKMKRLNAEAADEYEKNLAEAQANAL